MASHSVGISKGYDGSVTSKLYYEILNKRTKDKPLDQLMKINWVTMMIVRVESAKIVMQGNGELHPKAKQALLSYDVLEVTTPKGGKEKKLYQKSGALREVVPLGSTFPIVMEAHLMTNHGAEEEMNEWLARSNYAVSHICLPAILESCEECVKITQSVNFQILSKQAAANVDQIKSPLNKAGTNESFNPASKNRYKSFVQTVSMASFNLSNNFDTLLIYQDLSTGFIQLRPVSSSDITYSIFLELTHIFSDMSPPKSVIVNMSEENLFTQILERLSSIFNEKITLEITSVVDTTVTLIVKTMIERWSRQSEHSKWFIGCYVVQWDLNNIKDADGTSPYERVFGQSYNKAIVKSSEFELMDSNLSTNVSNDLNDFIHENPVLELPAQYK